MKKFYGWLALWCEALGFTQLSLWLFVKSFETEGLVKPRVSFKNFVSVIQELHRQPPPKVVVFEDKEEIELLGERFVNEIATIRTSKDVN